MRSSSVVYTGGSGLWRGGLRQPTGPRSAPAAQKPAISMNSRATLRAPIRLLAALALLASACSSEATSTSDEGVTGGSSTVGATGGAAPIGGAAPTTGGLSATGGTVSGTGGAATGGSATGGATTSGGVSPGSGGLGGSPASGGVPSGGATSSGGEPSGGGDPGGSASTGGTAPAGGSTTGGTGGAATGGAAGSTPALGGDGGTSTGGSGDGGAAAAGQSGAGGDAASGGAGGSPLPPTTDYSAPGPFTTTTDRSTGPDGQCTIFRPQTLGEDGFLHAPIVFGPGIGMQATQLSDLLLSFASHGFVVIGTGVLNGGPNDPNNRAAMENALNWILEQNDQPGIYQGKLDVTHAIAMGYSVGGTAAVEIGEHEAVATTVSIHGHIATSDLHGPMLQTSGTLDTVGLPMQQQTFDSSQVQTFLGTVEGADHGYIQANTGGVERPAIIAWMRYWIYADTGARHFFWGEDCVLCTAPWTNPQRKNWE